MEDNRLRVDYGYNVSFEEYTVFRYSRFSGIVLTDIQLHNKNFIECTFCGLTFVGCAFTDCFFIGGTVLTVKFENCFFTRCKFDTSFMSHTSLKDCHTLNCRITDSAFQHTYFHESAFHENNYLRCSFNSCDEDKCSRTNCHITECFGLSKTCPEVGAFIGWKRLKGNIIAKIEIPSYAYRTSGFSRKCRADCALVLDFYHTNGTEWPEVDNVPSIWDKNFIYTRGKMVYADSFDESRETCGHGIHFFLSFQEAVEHKQS